MLFIFQSLLPKRHTKPSETHVLIGDRPPASAAPLLSTPVAGAPPVPPAHAADGLAHYIDARLSDTRFRID